MDTLALRVARDATGKAKSAKSIKRLSKNNAKNSLPKVNSGTIEKPKLKQKEKNGAVISSKKKKLIKDILLEEKSKKTGDSESLVTNILTDKKKKLSVNLKDSSNSVPEVKKSKRIVAQNGQIKNESSLLSAKNQKKGIKLTNDLEKLKESKIKTTEPKMSKSSQIKKTVQSLNILDQIKPSQISEENPALKKSKKEKLVSKEEKNVKSSKKLKKLPIQSQKLEEVEVQKNKRKEKTIVQSDENVKSLKKSQKPKESKIQKKSEIEKIFVKKEKKIKSTENLKNQIVQSQKLQENGMQKKIKKEKKDFTKAKLIAPLNKSDSVECAKLKQHEVQMELRKKKLALQAEDQGMQEKSKKRKLSVQKENIDLNNKSSKKLKTSTGKLKQDNPEIKNIKSKKRKQAATSTEKSNVISLTFKKDEVKVCVDALFKLIENEEKEKKTLFNTEKPPILLMVTCIKVPKTPLHLMRFILPHSLVTSNDDVALLVSDLKKGRKRDYEDTVRHYEDILQQKNCTQIKTIIPMNQVKTEYRQFEMRRRLLNSYDHFLVDGKVSGHMTHLLGKTFREVRKLPTPIHMDKEDLKAEIDAALKKTSMEIHSRGDSYVAQIGSCSMTVDEVVDNILAAAEKLRDSFPGGWDNIRSLKIKTPLSLAIPIYMTLKSRDNVEVPVQNPKRPKAYEDVEGELSTFTLNVNAIVQPDGTVRLRKLEDDEDSDSKDNESDKFEDSENVKKDTTTTKDNHKTVNKEQSESEDDEESENVDNPDADNITDEEDDDESEEEDEDDNDETNEEDDSVDNNSLDEEDSEEEESDS